MIILTGGAGFIGSVVLAALNDAGHADIVVVDNLRSSDKWRNLLGKRFFAYWSREELRERIKSKTLGFIPSAVVHLGACSSTTETNVDYLIDNNVNYSVELAQLCDAHNCRFIYASSAATYGAGEQGFSEAIPLSSLRPLNAYGFSKYLFDLWLEQNGLLARSCGLKFFNVFGPNEFHKEGMRSMVLKGFEQISATGSLQLFKSEKKEYPDGGQVRDFIYVKDCAAVVLWLLQHANVNGIFNLGSGVARSWLDLGEGIFAALGKKSQIDFIAMPAGLAKQYQYYTCATMDKLRAAGYTQNFTSLEAAIQEYAQKYLVPHAYL